MPRPLPLIGPVPNAAACCAPLADSPLTAAEASELAVRIKALADPARLRLLSILLASEDQQACTCELTEPLGLSQPTVTHHLRKLLEAGLVSSERRGVWTYYRVVPDALGALAAVLSPAAGLAAAR
jgi:ArsR family transcriptional regulator, arsenate/arsenite/antimonite-responsive transcriptional repressor